MLILAVDPGVTSGIAYLDGAGHTALTLPYPDDEDWVRANIHFFSFIVCERFVLGQGTLKKTQAGSIATMERIGVVRHYARLHGKRFELQTPAESKEFDPKWKKLKQYGWYTPMTEGDHANSASRHLLLACVRLGVVDPRELLSPQEEDHGSS